MARSMEPVILVGIEDDPALDVARRAADGLDERGLGAQEALLVGIEDRHQRAFGNVEPLAQQVDADQHVEGAQAQVAQDLDALQRVDVGVHVAHADALFVQVFGQVLGHALGQRGDQRAVALLRDFAHSSSRSSTWVSTGRISTCGSIRPVGRMTCSAKTPPACSISQARRGGDEDRLRAHRVPFLERSGRLSMQDGRRKPYSASVALRPEVAAIHAADLRHGDMAFVGEDDGVVGDVFEQGRRRLAGRAAGEVARIVLDARAEPVASSISRSKFVRCSSRWASSSLPADQLLQPLGSSALIA
jgi:hypothetical protein